MLDSDGQSQVGTRNSHLTHQGIIRRGQHIITQHGNTSTHPTKTGASTSKITITNHNPPRETKNKNSRFQRERKCRDHPTVTDLGRESRRPRHNLEGRDDETLLWEAGNGGRPIGEEQSNPQQAAVAEPPESRPPQSPSDASSLGGAERHQMGWLDRTALTEEKKKEERKGRENGIGRFFYRDDKWGVRTLARSEILFKSGTGHTRDRAWWTLVGLVLNWRHLRSPLSLSRVQKTADVNRDLI